MLSLGQLLFYLTIGSGPNKLEYENAVSVFTALRAPMNTASAADPDDWITPSSTCRRDDDDFHDDDAGGAHHRGDGGSSTDQRRHINPRHNRRGIRGHNRKSQRVTPPAPCRARLGNARVEHRPRDKATYPPTSRCFGTSFG